MDIRDGVGGWELEDMDWDEETGLATFQYVHRQLGAAIEIKRPQPTRPDHPDWDPFEKQRVFSL